MATAVAPGRAPGKRKVARQSRFMADAMRQAEAKYGKRTRTTHDAASAFQMVLDRAVQLYMFCAEKADAERANTFVQDGVFGPTINKWVWAEQQARREVAALTAKAVELGLEERRVRVAEANAMLLARAVQEAAREVGLDRDQIKALGPALRRHLDAVDSTAQEVS